MPFKKKVVVAIPTLCALTLLLLIFYQTRSITITERDADYQTAADTALIARNQPNCTIHVCWLCVLRSGREAANAALLVKLAKAISSLSINHNHADSTVCVHLITNNFALVSDAVRHVDKTRLRVQLHRSAALNRHLRPLLPTLTNHFGWLDSVYYASLVLHHHFAHLDRLIVLDVDVWLRASVDELHALFAEFEPNHLIAIAHEQQPVYGNLLAEYRLSLNNRSTVGLAAQPGFNSGVLLLQLGRLRSSSAFAHYLTPTAIAKLAAKYKFKGHLGDQDLYTLIGFDSPALFKHLPCEWNRQLCKWWKYHSNQLKLPFDDYHRCDGHIKLYHANCGSPLPGNVVGSVAGSVTGSVARNVAGSVARNVARN